MFDDGIIPAQRRDEAETRRRAAAEEAQAARAAYDMALAGARREDKEAAAALVNQAARGRQRGEEPSQGRRHSRPRIRGGGPDHG